MNRHARKPGGVSPGGLLGVVVVAAMCGVLTFAWTIERSPLKGTARRAALRRGLIDPDRGWGGRARRLLAEGRYEALADSARNRMQAWGYDPEAWLFAAFAYEALADRPGLDGMSARMSARRVWARLLARCEPWRKYADPRGIIDWESYADSGDAPQGAFSSGYYAGWALLGLGRVTEARERFGRFAHQYRLRRPGRPGDDYNRACYASLAGDLADARVAWIRACTGGAIDPVWGAVDPDLEILHGEAVFDWMLQFARQRVEAGGRSAPVILRDD